MHRPHQQSVNLWETAAAHVEAAQHLQARINRPGYYSYVQVHSVLYLYCRSIELALKAYLLSNGLAIEELRDTRRYGHQIAKLYAEAKNRGILSLLSVTKTEEEILASMSVHYSNKSYEYPEHLWVQNKPSLDALAALCRKVVVGVEAIFPPRRSDRLLRGSLERRNLEK
jgi:hypothetical protein